MNPPVVYCNMCNGAKHIIVPTVNLSRVLQHPEEFDPYGEIIVETINCPECNGRGKVSLAITTINQ